MVQALRERSMAKRQRVIRERDIKQCQVEHDSSIDRISTLPDETLLFMLSFLPMEDAAKTSLLSRRWRYLWSFTPTLDFDGTSFLWKVASVEQTGLHFRWVNSVEIALDEQRRNFVGWVDSVIASHKAYTVERFRLFFNLTKFHHQHIDKWLRHALAKKVRTLELDLTKDCSRKYGFDIEYYYKFPCKLLREGSVDLKLLEKLCTHCVNVSGEAVEFLIRNCPRLEHVSIRRSGDLTSLEIIKPFPALKSLEISCCFSLDSVEIRDAGLVYLKYDGKKMTRFVLENVPLLTQLCIEGSIIMSMEDVLLTFSKHFPHLEMLKMCSIFSDHFSMEDTELFYSTAKLTRLKELVVKYSSSTHTSWLALANIVRAAPNLQRFVVEQWYRMPGIFDDTKFEKIVGVYPHLKEFEFVGYGGATSEVDLIKQLLHGASSLEKIVVDPRLVITETPFIMFHNMWAKRVVDDEIDGRARAEQQLPKIVPPGIVLEIL